MGYLETRDQFIQTWGELGVRWGISKTMAQLHALLLVSLRPLSYDEVIETLHISRGNAHNNIHNLLEWELISKVEIEGDKKDYFVAEKDVYKIFHKILIHRKRDELDPLIDQLRTLSDLEPDCQEGRNLKKMINDLTFISEKADSMLNLLLKSDISWLMSVLGKMVR
jgi:DNA-binding transcriptional regulator GbsR (MarR family)